MFVLSPISIFEILLLAPTNNLSNPVFLDILIEGKLLFSASNSVTPTKNSTPFALAIPTLSIFILLPTLYSVTMVELTSN